MNATGTVNERHLRVLIADEDEEALRGLHVSVREAVELIVTEDPQLAIVFMHNDDEHALALISEAVEYASGPVIALMRDADLDFLARAADRGISAYAESVEPESIQGTIEIAVRRYREAADLTDRVEQLEGALERRGTIERAKGILMERHSVPDRDAFEMLRDHSRASGRRVVDVAQSVLDGHALLPKQP